MEDPEIVNETRRTRETLFDRSTFFNIQQRNLFNPWSFIDCSKESCLDSVPTKTSFASVQRERIHTCAPILLGVSLLILRPGAYSTSSIRRSSCSFFSAVIASIDWMRSAARTKTCSSSLNRLTKSIFHMKIHVFDAA